ncbi:MAG TPA: hypothetical protein VM093_05610 [Aeromicrobium sp.]|nr:hypothetical protein [Aeromicrobium sp.]
MTRRCVAAVLLGLGVLVSACGGSGEAGLPTFDHAVKGDRVEPQSFLDALRASFRTGSTANVSFDVSAGAALRGAGAVRYAAHRMDADLRVDDWKVEGASVDIRMVDGTTYMRVPESHGLWVNLTDAGPGMPGADLAGDADPRQTIDDLKASISEVRFSGTERIGGVSTRRFEVVTKPKNRSAAGTSGASGHPVVTDYWFDRRDRVVRRQSELDGGRATFTWTRWGAEVRIVRPKRDEVITLRRLEQLRRQAVAPAG